MTRLVFFDIAIELHKMNFVDNYNTYHAKARNIRTHITVFEVIV